MQACSAATSTLLSILVFLQTSHTKSKAKEEKRAIQRPSGLDLKLHVRGPSGPGTMHDHRSVVLLSLKWRATQACTSCTDTVESAHTRLLLGFLVTCIIRSRRVVMASAKQPSPHKAMQFFCGLPQRHAQPLYTYMDLCVTTYDRLRSPVCVLTSQNNLVAQMLLRTQSSNMKLAPYRFLRRQGRQSGITEARRQPSPALTRCNTKKGTGELRG